MLYPIYFFEYLQMFVLKGNFFDDIGELGLSVDETANEEAAPADELLKFELFECVEVEWLDWLAKAYLHGIIINSMKVQVISHKDQAHLPSTGKPMKKSKKH
jgi:hypothetical protein